MLLEEVMRQLEEYGTEQNRKRIKPRSERAVIWS